MRWIVLTMVLALTSPAAAQDDEPTLGVSSGADEGSERAGGEDAGVDPEDDAATDDAATGDAAADAAADAASDAASDHASDHASDAATYDAPSDAASDEAAIDDAAEPEGSDDDVDAEDPDAEEPAPAPHWTDARVGAWAGFAASFGVAVLGGVLLAVGVDDLNTIENAPDGTVWADVAGARDRAPILTGFGAVVLGLGVAGTAASAALLAYFGSEGTWLEVTVLPTGLGVRGRF